MELNQQLTNRFEIAYKEGKTGKFDNFFDYLKRKKFKWDLLKSEAFLRLLSSDSSLFFNREKEIEKAGRLIGFTLGNKKPGHLPIVGIEKVGKSAFMRILKNLIIKIDKELSYSWISAEIFEEPDPDNIPRVLSWLEDIELEPPKVIFIEDAGNSLHIEKILERIFSIGFNGLLITTWTPEQWKATTYRIKSDIAHLLSNKLNIQTLKFEERINFLKFYLSIAKEEDPSEIDPFNEHSLELLANLSEGVPGIMIELIYIILKELSVEKSSNIEKIVERIARRYSIFQLKEKISNLSLIQKQILYKALLSPDSRGISPIQIHQELRRDRTTISSYLMKFVEEGILKRSKIGKYSYFRVSSLCKPYIQLAIQEEDLFLA